MKYKEEAEEFVPNAWSSELPADIVGLISDKLISFSLCEFIRFGAVCVGWRSFSIENYQHIKLPNKLPLLLTPLPSLSTKTDYHQIPSQGWMEKVEEDYGKEAVRVRFGVVDEEEEEEGIVRFGVVKEEEEEGEEEEGIVSEEEEEEEEEEIVKEKSDFYDPREIWQGQDYKQRYKSTRNFYSIYEKRVYHDFPLPVPSYKNIRGSSHGWLVTVEECCSDDGVDYYPVRLFNPFRTENNEIQLPPLCLLEPSYDNKIHTSYYLKKAYLSANPSSLSDPTTQLVVFGVNMRNRLAFCRPGDKVWTHVEDVEDEYRPIQDIICYQDQFYAILQNGFVFAFTIFDAAQLHPTPTPIVTRKLLPPQEEEEEDRYPSRGYTMRYLVECRGELLQIRRHVVTSSSSYKTSQFLVYKLDPTDPTKWVKTKTLNDHMFFLGISSTSISLSALDFPGCKPNSIYYTDNMEYVFMSYPSMGPSDIGVFNVEDGSFESHDALELKIMPPPIWIQPML